MYKTHPLILLHVYAVFSKYVNLPIPTVSNIKVNDIKKKTVYCTKFFPIKAKYSIKFHSLLDTNTGKSVNIFGSILQQSAINFSKLSHLLEIFSDH